MSRRLLLCERRFRKMRKEEDRQRCIDLRSNWTAAVRSAKADYWNKILQQTTPENVWKATRRRHTHKIPLPPIEGAVDFDAKCEEIRSALFPDPDGDDAN